MKLVITDENGALVFGAYRRHRAHTQETLSELFEEAFEKTGPCLLRARITGSGAINLGKALEIGFVQEVVAVAAALKSFYPQTDAAIELGGEDAKIIYFRGGLDERMNGVCAGGTGAFIDQMAALLKTDAKGLDAAAASAREIYPIAARCGVFAKTDIQPLINEGASREDLAASIFQAVVNQTISGLAQGKPIRGCVAFLGGPLHFLPELKKAFIRTLHLKDDEVVDPEDAHLYAAIGAALLAKAESEEKAENGETEEPVDITHFMELLKKGVKLQYEIKRLDPLFKDASEYESFRARHKRAVVKKADIRSAEGACFLGIDAGSTTTKLAVISADGTLLYSHYANNQGNPVKAAMEAIAGLEAVLPEKAYIARSLSTGYGEALLKAAFQMDEGEVETVAHTRAAEFFDPETDCVLDIGGQDMKCIRLKNHTVDTVLLNEACSSGCGSFIENFATSLGFTAEAFAKEALFAKHPVDLGTRCTVFMNSNVKQAQKEGAPVADISAGLAYSVIKNALYKVIKLSDAKALGSHIVVQGGTFYNEAVLRAFEKILDAEVTCPDIAGIMGAFGAALLARDRYHGEKSRMLSFSEIRNLSYTAKTTHCGGCENNCMLTVNTFSGGGRYISGNRCEKVVRNDTSAGMKPSMVEYKKKRIFDYEPLSKEEAPRGVIGIPRVLNMYENYPYWATFFRELGFSVVLSPFSKRKIYELGMESIPSESECYPAKLAHGHVEWLIREGVKQIFHPCVLYEYQEAESSQNHYNCPIVVSYPENLKNNVESITEQGVHYIRPFIAFTSEKTASDRLVDVCRKEWNIPEKEVKKAALRAWNEMRKAKEDVRKEGARLLSEMEKEGAYGIVLAGRPYHVDPEINHGIPELIQSSGLYVFTEDSLPIDFVPTRPIRVVDQWVYHSRLYAAAEFIRTRDDLEMIQLNSFGCGLDAVTTDQVAEILEKSGKLYTLLKIDEVNNLGAARIRIRSLLSAMKTRREKGIKAVPAPVEYKRQEFTEKMYEEGYTILAPGMSPIHFNLLQPVFRKYGFHLVMLNDAKRSAIDVGLKYVNNDACYPSIVTVGQLLEAALSGKYDTDRLALLMTQTGGCCRASNYVSFIRRALDKAGLSKIPVISLNFNGMEKNSGFKLNLRMAKDGFLSLLFGDLLERLLYRVRPYEVTPGSADRLHEKWEKAIIRHFADKDHAMSYKAIIRGIIHDFDTLPIHEDLKKPRVGIVGEVLVKYMPLANNHLVELLEAEGAEVIVPDFANFLSMLFYDREYRYEYLGAGLKSLALARFGVGFIEGVRKPFVKELKKSKRFQPPKSIKEIAEYAKPYLSLGNQYGEGWFLCGEMVELLEEGVKNIVCIQPFGCLPNHVVGKGVIKPLKKTYEGANIAAVDYDPGASEVNQLNRIKLMLAQARLLMKEEKEERA